MPLLGYNLLATLNFLDTIGARHFTWFQEDVEEFTEYNDPHQLVDVTHWVIHTSEIIQGNCGYVYMCHRVQKETSQNLLHCYIVLRLMIKNSFCSVLWTCVMKLDCRHLWYGLRVEDAVIYRCEIYPMIAACLSVHACSINNPAN